MKQSLVAQIEMTKNQLAHAKPHSRRWQELYLRVRGLITQQLRKEIRNGRITT